MSCSPSPSADLDQSNSDPDATIVRQNPDTRLQDDYSASGAGGPPGTQQQQVWPHNMAQMCQLIDNLHLQMAQMQRDSQQQILQVLHNSKHDAELAAQREAALEQRLDEMNHRFERIDLLHIGSAATTKRLAFPGASSSSNMDNDGRARQASHATAVGNNNDACFPSPHRSRIDMHTSAGLAHVSHMSTPPSASHMRTHSSSSTTTVHGSPHPDGLFSSTHVHAIHPASTQPANHFAHRPPLVSSSALPHREHEYNAAPNQMFLGNGNTDVVHRREYRRLLDLPPFSGLPEDWPKFEQAFRNTTAAYGYDDVENLLRLQKSLSGEAQRAVESLLIQPSHVAQVMETLCDTFGHPDLLVRSQIERARRQPQVLESHLEQLVPFSNVVRNVATYLDAPSTQHHLANPILLEELASKLPIARRVDWATVASQIKPYPTVKDFAVWVCGVARMVRLAIPSSTSSKVTTSQNSAACRTANKPEVPKRVLLNAAMVIEGEKQSRCGFCDKEHETERCFSFRKLLVTERWRIVMERRWCFGCLGNGHILSSCKTKQQCAVDGCNQWHHDLLHVRREEVRLPSANTKPPRVKARTKRRRRNKEVVESQISKATTQPSATTSAVVHHDATSASNDIQPARVCAVQGRTSTNTLLFRVMPITLHANGHVVRTFALLDEGSSVSLIDDSLAEELGADGPVADLSMKWFGKQTTVLRSRKLTIGVSGQDKTLNVLNVQTIRNLSLPVQTVDPETLYASNPHLRDVPFEPYRNAVPRVLIGLDNHHLGIPKELKSNEDDDGLVAVRSKLGWTIYGCDGPAYLPNATVLLVDGERGDVKHDLFDEIVRGSSESEEVRSKYAGVANVLPIIDFSRFSSYRSICRFIAWVLRFNYNASRKKDSTRRTSKELSAGEVDYGLKMLCRIVQMEVYAREYTTLQRGKSLERTSSIFALNPYLDDDGLMRLRGRTDAASDEHMGFDTRRPIHLPRQHRFTMLMVRWHHESLAHQLVDATIAVVRHRFWVPQVRVLVRTVQQACQRCRIRKAVLVPPLQGQLNSDRVTTVPDPSDIQSLRSREQWVRCRELSRRFWTRWVRDYPKREPPQPGDLVIVFDDGQPRSKWRCGRIRSAKVRTPDGEYWRPSTKLAILNINPPPMDSADGARDVANR